MIQEQIKLKNYTKVVENNFNLINLVIEVV